MHLCKERMKFIPCFCTGIAGMSRNLMTAQSEVEKEEAVTKLYVMLQQRIMWSRSPSSEVSDSLAEVLEINMPEFIKHLANTILRRDKQRSEQVRHISNSQHLEAHDCHRHLT